MYASHACTLELAGVLSLSSGNESKAWHTMVTLGRCFEEDEPAATLRVKTAPQYVGLRELH